MFSLIIKDILIQKKVVLLSFAYIAFFIIAMQGAGLVMYPVSLVVVTYMMALTSCAYDEKNKADIMLNSLPLKKSSIVMAKYLSIFVYISIGTVAYWLLTTLITLTGLPVNTKPVSLEGLAGGLFFIGLIHSIYFPVYFKIGYIKSKFLNLILFSILFLGLLSFINTFYVNDEFGWLKNAVNFMSTQTDLVNFVLISISTGIMLTASFILSLKVYKNRDLY